MRALIGAARRLALKAQFRLERAKERVSALVKATDPHLPLEHVQRRLELLLTAVYGRPIPIAPIATNVWNRERVRRMASRDQRARESTPSVDGDTIYLPAELGARAGDAEAIARYRLFALEQAERIARGTATHAPSSDPLERDLYLLRESAAIDAQIARAHPGIVEALGDERRAVLERRPKLEALTQVERNVEALVRETLSARLDDPPPHATDPSSSLAWARATANEIRKREPPGAVYRGLPPASLWGTVRSNAQGVETLDDADVARHRMRTGNFEANAQQSRKGESTQKSGQSAGKSTDKPDDTSPEGNGDGVELPTSRLTDPTRPQTTDRGTVAGVHAYQIVDQEMLDGLPPAVHYNEWSSESGAYVKRGAAVRMYPSEEGEDAWATDTLQHHAAIVRQIRHQFERLRARRTLLRRQRGGDELDLAACVGAIVDRRIGHPPDDRLYLDARPARRGLAISLLVDVSGSTEARVSDTWRIVDLEKIALLLATEALDALGDLYAVHTFAGKSAANVKLVTIKDFAERNGALVRRRIAALQPGGFTRLGAAIRHATHQLARQTAGHRLLLLLSDGRPNDIDQYQGPYGVEDARHAIFEARASGVFPFCLTIDRDASEYLPRIFGQAGHTILQHPKQLPTALLGAVRSLIKRS